MSSGSFCLITAQLSALEEINLLLSNHLAAEYYYYCSQILPFFLCLKYNKCLCHLLYVTCYEGICDGLLSGENIHVDQT